MKLDPRIKSLSDVLTCFDTEKAKQFIGENGYFADSIDCYQCLSNRVYGTLTRFEEGEYPFKEGKIKEGKGGNWRYFIPEKDLLPKPKRYRPYTLMEFNEKFTTGQPIKFRPKGEVGWERYLILSGYVHEPSGNQTFTYIYIGISGYTLDELFNAYEWQEHYTEDFKPFGVEVEE